MNGEKEIRFRETSIHGNSYYNTCVTIAKLRKQGWDKK